jgi:hypothetical protein
MLRKPIQNGLENEVEADRSGRGDWRKAPFIVLINDFHYLVEQLQPLIRRLLDLSSRVSCVVVFGNPPHERRLWEFRQFRVHVPRRRQVKKKHKETFRLQPVTQRLGSAQLVVFYHNFSTSRQKRDLNSLYLHTFTFRENDKLPRNDRTKSAFANTKRSLRNYHRKTTR